MAASTQIARLDGGQLNPDRPSVLEVLGHMDEALAYYREMAAAPASRLVALMRAGDAAALGGHRGRNGRAGARGRRGPAGARTSAPA